MSGTFEPDNEEKCKGGDPVRADPLPVPQVDPEALENAQLEQDLYPEENRIRMRKENALVRSIELENERQERASLREHDREILEMKTRHGLARYLVYGIGTVMVLVPVGVLIASGMTWMVWTDSVAIAAITSNPVGVAFVAIVLRYFFPGRKESP